MAAQEAIECISNDAGDNETEGDLVGKALQLKSASKVVNTIEDRCSKEGEADTKAGADAPGSTVIDHIDEVQEPWDNDGSTVRWNLPEDVSGTVYNPRFCCVIEKEDSEKEPPEGDVSLPTRGGVELNCHRRRRRRLRRPQTLQGDRRQCVAYGGGQCARALFGLRGRSE